MSAKYCAFCGTSLPDGARFCGECGKPVQAGAPAPPQAVQPPATPVPAAQSAPVSPPAEPILGMVPLVQRRKGFLGLKLETFSLIVTPARLIFPLITNQMTKEAIVQAKQEAKSEGRGFLGQWAAQLGWVSVLTRRLAEMSPDEILAQPAGGFFVPSADVARVWLEEEEDEDTGTAIKLFVQTRQGKHEFFVKGMATRDARDVLRNALGPIVR